jgi:hypothetical protein
MKSNRRQYGDVLLTEVFLYPCVDFVDSSSHYELGLDSSREQLIQVYAGEAK